MKIKYLELSTDYLIVNAAGYATATGLSAMMEGEISHDQMTRLLSKQEFSSKDLWLEVKATLSFFISSISLYIIIILYF